jgi:hypothetical protein
MDRIENDASKNLIVACVFVAAVTFSPSNKIGKIHRLMAGTYNYAVKMGSGAVTYIPSLIKD